MKKTKYISLLTMFAFFIIASISCSRSGSQVWEDTKTGGSYIGKGFKSFAGKHDDSRQLASQKDFKGPGDEDYEGSDGVGTASEDGVDATSEGGSGSSDVDGYSAVPASKDVPGESDGIPGIDGFSDPEALGLGDVFQHIHFDTDDDVVKGTENRMIIKKIAEYLVKNPSMCVFIEGHCDKFGTSAYNLPLGARRSNSVRSLLVSEGVNADNLFTVTYGKEKPFSMEDTPEGWRLNRRAQFKVYNKK